MRHVLFQQTEESGWAGCKIFEKGYLALSSMEEHRHFYEEARKLKRLLINTAIIFENETCKTCLLSDRFKRK